MIANYMYLLGYVIQNGRRDLNKSSIIDKDTFVALGEYEHSR